MNQTELINPEKALNNLYQAARLAPLKAEDHEVIVQSVISLQNSISQLKAPTGTSEDADTPKKKK